VDVAFRVRGDGDRLAEVFPGWKLEEVRDGRDRDVRDARNRGFRLSERGTGGQDDRSTRGSKTSFHGNASAAAYIRSIAASIRSGSRGATRRAARARMNVALEVFRLRHRRRKVKAPLDQVLRQDDDPVGASEKEHALRETRSEVHER